MADTNTFTGLQQDIDWHDFCKRMEQDSTAREAFATVLSIAQATIDADALTFLATPSSANLAGALGDTQVESSGSVVYDTNALLTTPTLDAATIANGLTGTGSDSNDFSASTGTFKTSSGANTLSGSTTIAADKNLACAAGTTAVDLSLGTGTFKTTTGAHTIGGDVTLAANKNISCASGTTAVDYSAGSGTFKTSTGTNTLSGSTALAANKDFSCASGTTAVDLSAGSGTFKTTTGLHTFGGKAAFKLIATPVAATGAGGGVAGAAALGAANFCIVSSDGATKGVKLPTGAVGHVVWVVNSSSTACNIFAASGGTLNGASADVGKAIPASKGVLCICTAADTWYVFDMNALAGAAA